MTVDGVASALAAHKRNSIQPQPERASTGLTTSVGHVRFLARQGRGAPIKWAEVAATQLREDLLYINEPQK